MLEMSGRNDSTGSVIAGFVIGGLVGTAIAMIFAPQTGANARDNFAWRPSVQRATTETNIRTKRTSAVTAPVNAALQRIVLDEGNNASPSSPEDL